MRDREKAEAYLTSGCDGCGAPVGGFVSCSGCLASLTALLAEVRREEREACAEVADEAEFAWHTHSVVPGALAGVAEAIRARTP